MLIFGRQGGKNDEILPNAVARTVHTLAHKDSCFFFITNLATWGRGTGTAGKAKEGTCFPRQFLCMPVANIHVPLHIFSTFV